MLARGRAGSEIDVCVKQDGQTVGARERERSRV